VPVGSGRRTQAYLATFVATSITRRNPDKSSERPPARPQGITNRRAERSTDDRFAVSIVGVALPYQNEGVVVRVDVNPELITWARQRSGIAQDDLNHRFPRLADWEEGVRAPTLKKLEDFARATHTPVGLLFLEEPPEEQVPIPDYRTMGGFAASRDEVSSHPPTVGVRSLFSPFTEVRNWAVRGMRGVLKT